MHTPQSAPANTAAEKVTLPPAQPASWTEYSFDQLMKLDRFTVETTQLQALQQRFAALRDKVKALQTLADKQGVDSIDSLEDVLPVCFDHRVYKTYPLSLLEKRQFAPLTKWLDRLTTHDLTQMSLEGLNTVDGWLDRLDEFGMIVGHSTGTTGKLSFIPRSNTEWKSWANAYFEAQTAATGGVDMREVAIPSISTGYRYGHHMMIKMTSKFADVSAGGDAMRYNFQDGRVSSDLMSLAGRLQAAEEKGELDKLQIDPSILQARDELIKKGRTKDEDMSAWFAALVEKFRGQRVLVGGTFAELYKLADAGMKAGAKCAFAPGSVLFGGGGLKGAKDIPNNWEDIVMEYFGIDRMCSMYGMSEMMPLAPLCSKGHFHFPPYAITYVLDEDAKPLPRRGAQTGRFTVFDLLAETYWGGFISGDKVTMHYEDDCGCGWNGPYMERNIVRYSEQEGGDDKITCAGSTKAYNEFMDYVQQI